MGYNFPILPIKRKQLKQLKKLTNAINKNDTHAVKTLLKKNIINARDKQGKTPLYYAIDTGNPELVELLIEKGADISNEVNKLGKSTSFEDAKITESPLYLVANKIRHENYLKIFKYLLNQGASLEKGYTLTDASGKKIIEEIFPLYMLVKKLGGTNLIKILNQIKEKCTEEKIENILGQKQSSTLKGSKDHGKTAYDLAKTLGYNDKETKDKILKLLNPKNVGITEITEI